MSKVFPPREGIRGRSEAELIDRGRRIISSGAIVTAMLDAASVIAFRKAEHRKARVRRERYGCCGEDSTRTVIEVISTKDDGEVFERSFMHKCGACGGDSCPAAANADLYERWRVVNSEYRFPAINVQDFGAASGGDHAFEG